MKVGDVVRVAPSFMQDLYAGAVGVIAREDEWHDWVVEFPSSDLRPLSCDEHVLEFVL